MARVLRDLGHPCAGETVVLGLSGGADSVSLLHVMAALSRPRRFTVVAAHLDHGLRAGSAEDAAFCRALCARLGVSFRTERADVRAGQRQDGGGIEEAARRARHAFLRRVKDEEGAAWIVLAHTRDDQAETVLLRLVRGAGALGLSAMRSEAGDLLRPMLDLSRRNVLDHLAARGLEWREDPSNADLAIARNRVRHELIPYLERHFNPAVREALGRVAAVLAEESDALAALSGGAAGVPRPEAQAEALSVSALRSAPRALARRAVRRALESAGGLRGVGLGHVDAIVDLASSAAPSGRRVALPGGRDAVFHFQEVRIAPRRPPAEAFETALSVPGDVALPDGRRLVARTDRGPAVSNGTSAVVAVPEGPLVVRTRRAGDRVRSAGREMSLKRFLMDRRVPAQDRASLPLLAAGHRVLWVPGQRIDGSDAATAQFLRVELCAAGDGSGQ